MLAFAAGSRTTTTSRARRACSTRCSSSSRTSRTLGCCACSATRSAPTPTGRARRLCTRIRAPDAYPEHSEGRPRPERRLSYPQPGYDPNAPRTGTSPTISAVRRRWRRISPITARQPSSRTRWTIRSATPPLPASAPGRATQFSTDPAAAGERPGVIMPQARESSERMRHDRTARRHPRSS
jgi:hypothetical protein